MPTDRASQHFSPLIRKEVGPRDGDHRAGQRGERVATDVTTNEFFSSWKFQNTAPSLPVAFFSVPFHRSSHVQTQTNLFPISKDLVVHLGLCLGQLASGYSCSPGPTGHITASVGSRADHSNDYNEDES